jgi:hypothetical protein
MKKLLTSIMIFFLTFVLSSCLPKEKSVDEKPSGLDLLENNSFQGKVFINIIYHYQEGNDTFIFKIEHKNNYLKNIYFKGNSLEILNAKAFGNTLNKKEINGGEYFEIDFEKLGIFEYPSFFLEINVPKDSIYKNIYYEETVKKNIVVHSFDFYLNYYQDSNEINSFNYRFCLDGNPKDYDDLNYKIVQYNNLEALLETSYYNKLYLPFVEDRKVEFPKEIIYYPNYDKCLFLIGNNISLRV